MPDPTVLTTKLNRRWLFKMVIFFAAALGIGVWGYYDATVVYPRRGRQHATFMLKEYLDTAEKAGRLTLASVEDPAAELTSLRSRPEALTDVERARYLWLESLSRVRNLEQLTQENRAELARRGTAGESPRDTETMFVDARDHLDLLKTGLATQSQPKPLSAFDIPVQYLIMAAGFGGAVWIAVVLLLASRRKFRYEPELNRLTMPGGRTIVPADIKELDRRQWKKFYGYLKLADGSPEIKLDLLRYEPLEAWILEMERLSPGYEPPEEEAAAPTAPAAGT